MFLSGAKERTGLLNMNLAPPKSSLGRPSDEPASPRKARVRQEAEECKVRGALFSHTCGERNGGAAESARLNAPANDREPNNKRSGRASRQSVKPKATRLTAHEPTESDRLLSSASSGLTRKAGSTPEVQLKRGATMKCPHCGKNIGDKLIAKHLASKGGSAIGPQKARSSEQARAAVMARIKKLGQKRRKT